MKDTKIIAGFTGIGKTYWAKNTTFNILDLSADTYDVNGKFDYHGYYSQILYSYKSNVYDYIVIDLSADVIELLNVHGIKIHLVYPCIDLKTEYLERYYDNKVDKQSINSARNKFYLTIKSFLELNNHLLTHTMVTTSNTFLKNIFENV